MKDLIFWSIVLYFSYKVLTHSSISKKDVIDALKNGYKGHNELMKNELTEYEKERERAVLENNPDIEKEAFLKFRTIFDELPEKIDQRFEKIKKDIGWSLYPSVFYPLLQPPDSTW